MSDSADTDAETAPDGGDSSSDTESAAESRKQRKVDRVAEKYGFSDFKIEMRERYESSGKDRWGARRCAKEFNKQIVEAVFQHQIGDRPTLGTTEEVMELLAGDRDDEDVDTTTYDRVVNWFEDRDVDPDEISGDFVNYRTVYQYLKEIQDAETPDLSVSPEERTSKALKDGTEALDRAETIINDKIETLQRTDIRPDTEIDVRVRAQVVCNSCGQVREFESYVTDGCECEVDDEE